jgi:hypothetical protein
MWLHLWSCARYDLHLSSEEFYALTPRQFDALIKRHRHTVESNELLLGQLTSWVANTGFRSTEKPTHPEDFMPSQWGKASASVASSSGEMTAERRAAVADGLRSFFRPFQKK